MGQGGGGLQGVLCLPGTVTPGLLRGLDRQVQFTAAALQFAVLALPPLFHSRHGKFIIAYPQAILHIFLNILLQNGNFLQKFRTVRHTEFSCRRRGRCPKIRHVIQNRGVDLMADSGNHRLSARSGGSGDAFAVENPEVLFASAAACHQDQIGPGSRSSAKIPAMILDSASRPCTVTGASKSRTIGQRRRDHILNILPGGARFAGNYANAMRVLRAAAVCVPAQTIPSASSFL